MTVTRCAWCERYSVGEMWIGAARLDAAFAPGTWRVSHGICPDCFEDLSRAGEAS